ncbi:MAG: hypothetical protein V2I36_16725 [Desulfopila sp.]|jgi:hypothetical protein|nr:hypothetical protein [Desulfopila sp.]
METTVGLFRGRVEKIMLQLSVFAEPMGFILDLSKDIEAAHSAQNHDQGNSP